MGAARKFLKHHELLHLMIQQLICVSVCFVGIVLLGALRVCKGRDWKQLATAHATMQARH